MASTALENSADSDWQIGNTEPRRTKTGLKNDFGGPVDVSGQANKFNRCRCSVCTNCVWRHKIPITLRG